jgi:subfamily B ATP-binding cassette protein HlyB/CyaB
VTQFRSQAAGEPVQGGAANAGADRLSLALTARELVWTAGSFAAIHRIPFSPELFLGQFAPPYTLATLVRAGHALGFHVDAAPIAPSALASLKLPCVALVAAAPSEGDERRLRPTLVTAVSDGRVVLFAPETETPTSVPRALFEARFAGFALTFARKPEPAADADAKAQAGRSFGFGWFVPPLLKHRTVWRDVLVASLVLQLIGLATPLLTQVVIDKVVVHQVTSTLAVIGIALAVFMVFGCLLGWVRQYLVLHTGNRVDAVLGAAVFEHLFRLPPRYFEHRPTGVIAARLHGVETIREFVAGAAVTLALDCPFLLVFVGVMLYYSVTLTLVVLAILGAIAALSLALAPVFQARLNQQFLLGARNQAFVTEYVAGLETVKCLQLEPQLDARYAGFLANYLQAGFRTRQLGNTYNTAAQTLEQLMTLSILVIGAWMVMNSAEFTIGMLVAFQMFASRLSQPMLRIVGLWQQFQQAALAVKRLGDIMDAPTEPYAITPAREAAGPGRIEIEGLAFRYGEDLPHLFRDLNLTIEPGQAVALMGPSGSGKSTLAKLLLGFYPPTDGAIRLDGLDTRHLSANELRGAFGVVPQETVLFSGTLYDNLVMANPHASFADVVQACKLAEIHQVIERLPQGYQTVVGERGVGLSGGQRQRIAIARALLKRPKILVFDEAASSLDPQTAEHFGRTLSALRGNVTMLFIAHQLPRSLKLDAIVRIGEPGPVPAPAPAPVAEMAG